MNGRKTGLSITLPLNNLYEHTLSLLIYVCVCAMQRSVTAQCYYPGALITQLSRFSTKKCLATFQVI